MLGLTPLQYALTALSGFAVGFSLALIGGGGSILAIPLLLYFVGLAYDPRYSADYVSHLAIGTTALAVGLNAYINAFIHWRRGNVQVREGRPSRRSARWAATSERGRGSWFAGRSSSSCWAS